MSTNCYTGSLDPSGTITYVYVHNAGDPAHAGTVLAEHYTSQAKINSLLSLGSLSPNPPMDRDGRGEDTGSGERK